MITMVLCLVPLSASVFLWYFCQDWKEIIAGPILTAIALLVVCHGIFDTNSLWMDDAKLQKRNKTIFHGHEKFCYAKSLQKIMRR